MKRVVLIRVEGSLQIGLGHFVRCTALAHMLKDVFEVTFFCSEIPDTLLTELNDNGFGCILIDNENEFLRNLSENIIVVLDGYHFDTDFQKGIKATNAKLVCIDDLHDKEFVADLIINHAPGVTSSDYKAQPYTQFALGLEYALLRPAFLEQAKKNRKIERIETLMICFGGSDPKGFTQRALEVAIGFSKFKKIIVVTGSAYLISDEFNQLVSSDSRIEHRHSLNEQQMAATMLESDIAFVPASGILLETICCGCIPFTCWFADNQKEFYSYMFNKIGLSTFGDNSITFQSDNLFQLLKNYSLNYNKTIEEFRIKIGDSRNNLLNHFNSLLIQ